MQPDIQAQSAHPRVIDVNNNSWNVYEARPTRHGFDLLFGLPVSSPRQNFRHGSPSLIPTSQLKEFWETNSAANDEVLFGLPASRFILERVRQSLGFQPRQDFEKLFRTHVRELKTLAPEEFAKRHGITVSAAKRKRLSLFRRATRPRNWWIKPELLQILTSGLPPKQIAEKIGISVTGAKRLRLKASGLLNLPVAPARKYKPKNWWKQPETLDILTSGLTEGQLSEKLGITAGYASRLRAGARILLNLPVPVANRRPPKVRSKNWWRDPGVLQILTSGASSSQVSEMLGISSTYASHLRAQACTHLNIPLPNSSRTRPLNWWQEPETLQILTSGLTQLQIAQKLGISASQVGRLLGKARLHLNAA